MAKRKATDIYNADISKALRLSREEEERTAGVDAAEAGHIAEALRLSREEEERTAGADAEEAGQIAKAERLSRKEKERLDTLCKREHGYADANLRAILLRVSPVASDGVSVLLRCCGTERRLLGNCFYRAIGAKINEFLAGKCPSRDHSEIRKVLVDWLQVRPH